MPIDNIGDYGSDAVFFRDSPAEEALKHRDLYRNDVFIRTTPAYGRASLFPDPCAVATPMQRQSTALHEMAACGDVEELTRLLRNPHYDVNERGVNNTTPLIEAVRWQRAKAAELLLTHGADGSLAASPRYKPGAVSPMQLVLENESWPCYAVLVRAGVPSPPVDRLPLQWRHDAEALLAELANPRTP